MHLSFYPPGRPLWLPCLAACLASANCSPHLACCHIVALRARTALQHIPAGPALQAELLRERALVLLAEQQRRAVGLAVTWAVPPDELHVRTGRPSSQPGAQLAAGAICALPLQASACWLLGAAAAQQVQAAACTECVAGCCCALLATCCSQVLELAVLPESRRQGVARRLMKAAIDMQR